jgi:hypothetical protein
LPAYKETPGSANTIFCRIDSRRFFLARLEIANYFHLAKRGKKP